MEFILWIPNVVGVTGAFWSSAIFGESLQSTTRSQCMLLLDSLEMADPRRLESEIRRCVIPQSSTISIYFGQTLLSVRVFKLQAFMFIFRFVLYIYKTRDRPETKHLESRIPFLVPKVIINLPMRWFSFPV